MSNPNKEKGAETERRVAAFLSEWWPKARRKLGEGRQDDEGDIGGIPFTCQVKYVAQARLGPWMRATLKQRDHAGNSHCLLVVRKKYKLPAQWDAYMPLWQIGAVLVPEEDEDNWIRMDLVLAARLLHSLYLQSSLTTESK